MDLDFPMQTVALADVLPSQTLAFASLAGVFCLLAAVLLGGLAYYSMNRSTPAPPPRQPAPPPVAPPPPAASLAAQGALRSNASLPGGPDGAYDEEEMPTVVMQQRPSPAPAAPKAPARPAQPDPSARTRGATIIAFDDEDEDA